MRRSGFPFWQFSMRVYRTPRIAEACLALQDDCGVDVNLLLFCCWMGRSGRSLKRQALRAAIRAVAPWQSEVVQPLRRARRTLKQGFRSVEPEYCRLLRKRVGAAELEAEYVEQRTLAERAAELPVLARKCEPRVAAEANLKHYLELLGLRLGRREARNVAILIAACSARPTSAPGR
ncbi:MAG: TIGR02444 family protein [Betaproteobacteria bacterium]|nr:TIGR02444 family protein [Betaproteobacteria bacterium]